MGDMTSDAGREADPAPSQLAQSQISSLTPRTIFSRRGFAKTTLGAGFALAAQPVTAQTVITTSDKGLVAGQVQVTTADGMMPAYRAYPKGKLGSPVVLVIHEIFGVHEHIKDLCRRLAKAGYYAIAPDLYARDGDASQISDIPTLTAPGGIVSQATDARVRGDLDATVRYAGRDKAADIRKLGVTGFCWGGRQSWLYTEQTPAVKAAAAWYGPLAGAGNSPISLASGVRGRMIGFYGAKDTGITAEQVEAMRAALNAAGDSDSRIIVYKDAQHGFNADYRPSYNAADAKAAWIDMIRWFKDHGVAPF